MGITFAALTVFAPVVLLFGPDPASAEQDDVPVFFIGEDGGLSPLVLWCDSKEFRGVALSSIAEALARAGIRAIGEEPYRARFNADGVAGDSSSRWDCLDFVHFAPQVPVDDSGSTTTHVVCVDVWVRRCCDDGSFFCTEVGASVRDAASGEHILGTGQGVRYPIPSDYKGGGLQPPWLARSKDLFRPLGAKRAGLFSEHPANGTSRGGSSDPGKVEGQMSKGPTAAPRPSTGARFRDCAVCPALVAIEPGSFLMGQQERSHCRDENAPVVEVKIARPFAAGVFEVTVDEWAACRREGGCSHDPPEWNPGRANRPVTGVSWEDAQQYVRWLSAKTGEKYRLLSEAEWLYVSSERRDGRNWYPLPRSCSGPNRFGLHGLLGSTMEWLDEPGSRCFSEATDASVKDDERRVLRGPSDCHFPRAVHRARRDSEFRWVRDECYGFRVARELGQWTRSRS